MNEPIAFARTAREEELIEAALEADGIAYAITLEAAGDGVCYLARAYCVEPDDAACARAALASRGLSSLCAP